MFEDDKEGQTFDHVPGSEYFKVVKPYLSFADFDKYQRLAVNTAVYPPGLAYPALGLTGEHAELIEKVLQAGANAGKIAERVKKILRDKAAIADEADIAALIKEGGDQLWYIANIFDEIGIPLSLVAQMNITKVQDRNKRGVVAGSGDNR